MFLSFCCRRGRVGDGSYTASHFHFYPHDNTRQGVYRWRISSLLLSFSLRCITCFTFEPFFRPKSVLDLPIFLVFSDLLSQAIPSLLDDQPSLINIPVSTCAAVSVRSAVC